MLRAKQKQFKPCQAVRNMRNGPCAAQVCNLGHHGQVPKPSGPRCEMRIVTPAAFFKNELKMEAHCPEDERAARLTLP